MKRVIIIGMAFVLLFIPISVSAQENIVFENPSNNTSSQEHSNILDGINQIVEDDSHSEIIDSINEQKDEYDHSDLNTIITQFNNINSLNSYTGLVLGIIAIVITISFGVIARKQNTTTNNMIRETKLLTTETKLLTTEIKKEIQESAEIRKEIRGDVSLVLDGRLDSVIHSLDQSRKMYEKFLKETNQNQVEIWRINMKNDYDRAYAQLDLKLELIELMKIFGATPARKYWFLLNKLGRKSDTYGHEELSTLDSDIEGYLKDCVEIKKIIKPWIIQR